MSEVQIQKKQKRVIIYVMIISLICAVGISYAFFTAGMSSETSTTIRADAGTMKITYDGGANITLSGIYPRDEVWATKNITVTGNNTTDAEMYYKLTLVVDSNTFKTSDPLQYELVSTNTSTNGEIIPAISKTDITSSSIELGNGHFIKANNAKHTYQLKIYYPKKTTSQNDNQGASFSAHVEITSIKASTGGNLANLILANNEIKTPVTTPGKAISTASEALLASTEDDYGTSYYFRGAVKNNYVQFANKCWRVVRINGDSSIKLVLHNDNTSKAANPCAAANNSDTAAFAHYNGSTYTSRFNSNYTVNAHVGFMYGTTGSSDYATTHANTNKSTILTNLETWYKNNLASYENLLADTIWCNDKSTFTTYTSGTTYGTGLGYGTNTTGYGAYNRLYGGDAASYASPSLKCPNDNNGGKLSKFTVDDTTNGNGNLTYKIGLLTADELAFAGYSNASGNTTTYLQENTTGNYWWSLCPGGFLGGYAGVWGVLGDYGGLDIGDVHRIVGVRPSISLKSTTNVTGDGTSENPYKVDETVIPNTATKIDVTDLSLLANNTYYIGNILGKKNVDGLLSSTVSTVLNSKGLLGKDTAVFSSDKSSVTNKTATEFTFTDGTPVSNNQSDGYYYYIKTSNNEYLKINEDTSVELTTTPTRLKVKLCTLENKSGQIVISNESETMYLNFYGGASDKGDDKFAGWNEIDNNAGMVLYKLNK